MNVSAMTSVAPTTPATTMRAYSLVGARRPEIVTLPVPEPGPGQVRLRVAGAGLCHSDLVLMQADPPFFPLPKIIGHETTGWVDKLGADVRGVEIGKAYGVYFTWGCGHCAPCVHGEENVCDHSSVTPGFGTGLDGGMAEYVIIDDPRHLIPLGDLDPIDAAKVLSAGSTAVVIGVGGLGHLAIQILKALSPARIIAVDTQAEKLTQALSLGADHALAAGAGAAEEVRRLTGGLGAALVIDLVGSDVTLGFALSVLAQRGQIKLVGVGGGTLPVSFFAMPRESSISTPYAGSIGDLIEVVRLAEDRLVEPEVTRIGFDQLDETFALMDRGGLRGRAVLVPGQ
jgi:propanol-preferring alcohol dehydrogenase